MATDNTSGLWFDAERRSPARPDRETIPRRIVLAMFGLALVSLLLVSLSVATGRPLVGQPHPAEAVRGHTVTITGEGTHVNVTDDRGRVLLDGNGGFVDVVLDGLTRARRVARVEGNAPVTIIQYDNGRVTLSDPSSGWQVELTSFGPANTGTFLKMLNGE